MTDGAPNWFAKVGPWTALLCAALTLMAVAGAAQIVFVRQEAQYWTQMTGFEMPGTSTMVWFAIGQIILRSALLLMCVGVLASQFQRGSITFVLAAIWFVFPVMPLVASYLQDLALGSAALGSGPLLSPIDLALNLVITAYLLFSRRVAELYNIDTRTRIPATLRKLWAQARGRPIPEEIEASRLHETFK